MPAISPSCAAPVLLTVFVLSGCSAPRSTVGDGMFQKRHLRPGWHVDLGGQDIPRTREHVVSAPRMEPRPHHFAIHAPRPPDARVGIPEQDHATTSIAPNASASSDHFAEFLIGPQIQTLIPDTTRSVRQQQIERPARRWNPWAIPAFVAAAGTVVLGLATGTSLILVVVGVLLTLVLSSIALRKGRKNEWSGKGFAVAAMILGVLAALITLIAVVAGGA